MRIISSIALLLGMSVPSCAQVPGYIVSAGQVDANDVPISGARVCRANQPASCFEMPKLSNGSVDYEFALEPSIRSIRVEGEKEWILFKSTFSGGGSGTLTRYAVLRHDGPHWKNLLPTLALTNVSDFAVWNEPKMSAYPVIIDADFLWNKGETHFGRHFYAIRVWRFDTSRDQYAKVLTYRTLRKYDGGDEATIAVIAPERREVLRRISAADTKR